MKVAIDISPTQNSQHMVRGVGSYIAALKAHLEKTNGDIAFQFFTDLHEIDSDTDLIHYPYFDPFQRFAQGKKNIKIVITIHDLTPLVLKKFFPVGVKGNIQWEINKWMLRRVNGIITDSQSSKTDIAELVGTDKAKIQVAYLAAGEAFSQIPNPKVRIHALQEKYKLPDRFALYVGDVTANKNLPCIIAAVKKINVPLVLVGKALVSEDFDRTHPWNKDLLSIQQIVKDDKQFVLPGYVSDVDLVTFYNAAVVFVMPSLYEGFGLPVLEGMQCGCPVVTTERGSLSEVAGNAAFFVDPYDIGSIASGINRLWTDEKLRKEYRERGLIQAAKFNWQKTAEETVSVYEKVLSGKL